MQRRLTHVGTIDSMNGKHSFRCCVKSKPHSFTGPVESIGEQPWLLWTLPDELTDSVTHSTSYWTKHGILFANFVSFMERNPRCAHWIITDWKAQTGTWLHKHIESLLAPAGFKTPGCANADDVGAFDHRGAAISKNSSLCLTCFLITKVFLLLGGTLRWNPLNMAAVSHRSLVFFFLDCGYIEKTGFKL